MNNSADWTWIGCIFVLVSCTWGANSASAQMQWSGNGHYYKVVNSVEIAWFNAYQEATASSYLGNPGYLATVTSAGEQSFIEGMLDGGFQYWIGGYQSADGIEPCGGWSWDTSEPWGSYMNWDSGQPDDNGVGNPGGEDFLAMFANTGHLGRWNDEDNPGCQFHGTISGYVIEYGGTTGSLAQPLGGCRVCGNGMCEAGETRCNCPMDCGATFCGDGCCGGVETQNTCPADCAPTICGDGCCGEGETQSTCPADCGSPPAAPAVPAIRPSGIAVLTGALFCLMFILFRQRNITA